MQKSPDANSFCDAPKAVHRRIYIHVYIHTYTHAYIQNSTDAGGPTDASKADDDFLAGSVKDSSAAKITKQLDTLQKYDTYITNKVEAQKQKIADLQAQLSKTNSDTH
jgi:hypothetical protein